MPVTAAPMAPEVVMPTDVRPLPISPAIQPSQAYYERGPYALADPVKFNLDVNSTEKDKIQLKVYVTIPKVTQPAPLLVMFNGFQCKGQWYHDFVDHVASWGYCVVNYTTPSFKAVPPSITSVPDAQELNFLQPVLAEVKRQPAVVEAVGFEPYMAVMGHSRGGKLATFHYARGLKGLGPKFETAVLLDPVDGNPGTAPKKEEFPSAVELMKGVRDEAKAAGKPLPQAAIIAAGKKFKVPLLDKLIPPLANAITNWMSANPPDFDYTKFASSMPGSWHAVVPKAGHMQFCNTEDLTWRLLNSLDHDIKEEALITASATIAVAWLDKHFNKDRYAAKVGSFVTWRDQTEQSKFFTFTPDSV